MAAHGEIAMHPQAGNRAPVALDVALIGLPQALGEADRRVAQHQFADLAGGMRLPDMSTMSAPTPSAGRENEPGFIGWFGVPMKMQPPTSVPPEMLMIGILLLQTCSKNQRHGASVQASPPEVVMRRLVRS